MGSTQFDAIITHNRNAVVIDGTDGGHVTLDVPDNCIAGLAALVVARNKQLKVKISWDEHEEDRGGDDD